MHSWLPSASGFCVARHIKTHINDLSSNPTPTPRVRSKQLCPCLSTPGLVGIQEAELSRILQSNSSTYLHTQRIFLIFLRWFDAKPTKRGKILVGKPTFLHM